jgi:drug/metabolite transporter (DMT)-like permease
VSTTTHFDLSLLVVQRTNHRCNSDDIKKKKKKTSTHLSSSKKTLAPPFILIMLSDRDKGILIILFGILCVSPDAVFLRILSNTAEAPLPIILFWKSLCKATVIATYISFTHGVKQTFQDMSLSPKHIIVGTLFQSCMEFGFTSMFVFTTTARALLFYSLNPLWSALMGRIVLGDPLKWHTIITLVLAFFSVMLTFGSQVIMGTQAESGSSIVGDFIAIGTGLATSGFISTVRSARKVNTSIFMQPCCVGGTTTAAIGSLLFRSVIQKKTVIFSSSVSLFYPLIFVDAMLVAVMPIAITMAGKVLLGAEVSLITLLQSLVGPLLMFIIFNEIPNAWTLGGGLLLLLSIAFHEYLAMKFKIIKRNSLVAPAPAPGEGIEVVVNELSTTTGLATAKVKPIGDIENNQVGDDGDIIINK